MSARPLIVAVVCGAAFLGLGVLVDAFGPWGWDHGWQSGAAWLAFWSLLTALGLFPAYAFLSLALLALGAVVAPTRRATIVTVVGLAALWNIGDAMKLLFHRARPQGWHGVHESSFSYPSGHAELSLFFYGAIALWIVGPHLRGTARALALTACVVLPLAIAASRVALGVHYLTDLAGGWLLAATWLALVGLVAYPRAAAGRLTHQV